MMNDLTLNQLLTNPTGFNSAFMSARYRIIEDLGNRYNALIKTHGAFKYNIYKDATSYYFIFKIPSEKFPSLFYDVVIEFFEHEDEEVHDDKTLNRYYLRLFSNSPNFTFTYTYVVNKYGLIPDLVKNKCSRIALTQPPTERNPIEVFGFEKSCYYACMFIKEHKLTNKFGIMNRLLSIDKTNKKIILDDIKSDDGKLFEYNNLKKDEQRKKNKKPTRRSTTKRPISKPNDNKKTLNNPRPKSPPRKK